MKEFNVEGLCLPELHYMVDIEEQLLAIEKLVSRRKYFTINRGRQYGKTTILHALKRKLDEEYCVFLLSFEGIGADAFSSSATFCKHLFKLFYDTIEFGEVTGIPDEITEQLYDLSREDAKPTTLQTFTDFVVKICKQVEKPVVLIVDEVDAASNNDLFITFLGRLRDMYLRRMTRPTFHSVILAGVYDVKNLKEKIRPEDKRVTNSPWNIAAQFDVDMSLSKKGILEMLSEYEADHQTGMDINEMSSLIYDYTSGYPFLVSRLCKLLDEEVAESDEFEHKSLAWTKKGFLVALRVILTEQNTLFESLTGKLIDFPGLNKMIYRLLFSGMQMGYNIDNPATSIAEMFGFIKNKNHIAVISNRIFETRLYNRYLSTDEMESNDIYEASLREKSQFIINGHLNMRRILERFVVHFNDLYGDCDEIFLEEDGRKYFLLFIKSIINGIGNYYVEARTRSMGKTDVIVDYGGEQYIIEMKIWRGNEYHTRGEQQLVGYLDDYRVDKGYMLSFNFNKKKQIGVQDIVIGDKLIVEAVV